MAQFTEHLSKRLLGRFGLPVPPGRLASTADQAAEGAALLGVPVAVKAQVPVGGRGKAGAIRRADTPADAAAAFHVVTGLQISGLQTVEVLVEPWQPCAAEYYLAVVVDAAACGPVLLFSASGGVDVESAGAVCRLPLREDNTLPASALRRAAYARGAPGSVVEQLLIIPIAEGLARAHIALDAVLIEVNPLGVRPDGKLTALDARVVLDDHALHRQPELERLVAEMRPRRSEDLVRDAVRLEYVRLEGWLGLISGGAGMTMAVMDLIADLGGAPACFLDCSVNPTSAGYGAALDLLLGDAPVRAILISIFGGLTRVDLVAHALVKLLAHRHPQKPITLRLAGTNGERANAILAAAGLVNHRSLEEAISAAIASARPA